MKVRILTLDSPTYVSHVVMWLCKKHTDERRAKGWVVTDQKKPPFDYLECDDCRREANVPGPV